jgi:two-component system, cell cycle sensor histidine kinase and response regulator CckA
MPNEKQRLLLVEDEALVALDLKRRLEGMGYEVAGHAVTGEEAIQKAMALTPSLVLMDIRLGGLVDGIEATEIIRRRLDVPVVYLTADAEEATLRRARVTEPHGFVLKPIRDRELRIAIEMALYRFKAEAVMRESREWFAATLHDVNDAVSADDKDWAVHCVSVANEQLSGWKQEEAKGQPLGEVFRFLNDANLKMKTRENQRPKGDGAETEAPREEAESRDKERMRARKEKLDAIGRMASGVAHDFNNMLTAIIGYSNLALLKMPEDDPVREDIIRVRDSGERAVELTQQLLAFGRRQMLAPSAIDLGAMCRNLEKPISRLLGDDVEILISGDEPLWSVRADRSQLEQALIYLAVHAKDSMPEGGKLAVQTRNMRLTEASIPPEEDMPPGDYVMLGVSDTGPGMDDETRSHLFEPFFTSKSHGRGAGMELATVYGIVTQSGGYISVQSEPGRGSIFKVFLPAMPAPQVNPAGSEAGHRDIRASDPLAAPQGDETILLVEDEKAVRGYLRETLERKGYRVLEAASGEDALEMAMEAASRGATLPGSEGEIKLLLTDVVMGGINGRDLAEQVLGRLPGLKVLYISGFADRALVRNEVIEEGLEFLRKPFTPDDLARKVREVLNSR